MSRIAVFIDRDGTIIEELEYLKDLERIRLIPHSADAIRSLNEREILAIIVSNQAGVARGYFLEETVRKINERLEELLSKEGAHLDAIYYCPHHPEFGSPEYRKDCNCRKPKPGMLWKSAKKFHLNLKDCYVIGDRADDIRLAQNGGAKGILVLTGYGQKAKEEIKPDHMAKDLYQAVRWILEECGQ